MTEYLCLSIEAPRDVAEMLIALLAELGFEAFEEKAKGIEAYIRTEDWTNDTQEATHHWLNNFGVTHQLQAVEDKNWNALWESRFESITIGDFCYLYADFHSPTHNCRYAVKIAPKMAFGTGHHATTRLVIETMEGIDFNGRKVLDWGCGTGVLAILALKMGAVSALALDNDPVAVENAEEHGILNEVGAAYEVQCGSLELAVGTYEVILANITRNILLEHLAELALLLRKGGILVLSGFHQTDVPAMQAATEAVGLELQSETAKTPWACLRFTRG